MKKQLQLLFAALLVPAVALASEVTLEQARAQARQVMIQRCPVRVGGVGTQPRLAYAPHSADGLTDFYVFNYGDDSGFAIIAGDDRAVPVLAYGERGSFDATDMPCNLRWRLEMYQREMQIIRENKESFSRAGDGLHVAPAPAFLQTIKTFDCL